MRIPRDVSGAHLADILCRRWHYTKVHQVGSHIILETSEPTRHRIAIPDHPHLHPCDQATARRMELERMREELVRRNYAANTIDSYLRIVKDFQEYAHKPLDRVNPDDLRRYHAYLLEERKLAVRSVVQRVAAVRFLYCKTLKRRDMKEDLPYPRNYRRKLPVVLSPEEAGRLIDSARNLFHRALIMTLYACGLRRTEAARLKVSDIDSQRMMIRVSHGKGVVDRDVLLSPALLDTLREYWRWMRPKTFLFPGTQNGWRTDKPITSKMLWAGRPLCSRESAPAALPIGH